MTECCGQPRAGRFCSECGKQLANGPLLDLLAHCRQTEKAQRKQADGHKKAHEDEPDGWYPTQIKKCADRAAAWKARGDALAELMARGESEAPQ
jgi:hypothetical protein